MADSASDLQTRLDALDVAIERHELEVTFADRTVRYKSNDDLMKARQGLLDRVSALTRTRSKQTLGVASKGF